MTSESYVCDKCGHDYLSEEGLKNHKREMSDAHDWTHDKHGDAIKSESMDSDAIKSESMDSDAIKSESMDSDAIKSESYVCDKCGHDYLSEEGLKNHKREMSDAHDWIHDR
jgi:rubredoxin